MSLFSIYVGFVYNETFSVAMSYGRSQWLPPPVNDTQKTIDPQYIPIFGVDAVRGRIPASPERELTWSGAQGWAHTTNKLTFFNSLKMKMSIIIGVLQARERSPLSCDMPPESRP